MTQNRRQKISAIWPFLLGLIACTFLYFLAARLGLLIATEYVSASPVWPATGLAIGLLYRYGWRLWPGVMLGAYLANEQTGVGWSVASLIACGNTLEALTGAYVLHRSPHFFKRYTYQADLFTFLLVGFLPTLCSSVFGTVASYDPKTWTYYQTWHFFLTWWAGDLQGALIVLPLFLLLTDARQNNSFHWLFQAKRPLVYGLAIIFLAALLVLHSDSLASLMMLFALLLLGQIYAGLYFGRIFIPIVLSLCVSRSVMGSGYFASSSVNQNLLYLQLFMTVLVITGFCVEGFIRSRSMRSTPYVLLLGWLMTALVIETLHRAQSETDDRHFKFLVHEAQQTLGSRIDSYINILRAGVALHYGSSEVTQKEWLAFVSEVFAQGHYQGLGGMGVIKSISGSDVDSMVARKRREGIEDFRLHTLTAEPQAPSADEKLYIIDFVEPLATNRGVQGLIVGSEPKRRRAAELARDTGQAVISSSVSLIQDKTHRPGFLIFLPIYSGGRSPPSLEDRRLRLKAWVYAPFVMEDFFREALRSLKGQIDVRVFEGIELRPENIVASIVQKTNQNFHALAFDHLERVEYGQNIFTLAISKAPGFATAHDATIPWVGFFGSLITILFGAVVVASQNLNQKAQTIVEEKTSRLRTSEEQLIAAREAALAGLRSKSEFLANMSHEIRTPINGIIGMTDLLLTAETKDEKIKRLLTIKRCSDGLLNIIDDVLDFSKMEAGKLVVEEIPFDLLVMIEDMIDIFSLAAKSKNIEISSHIDPSLSEQAIYIGDPHRLRQILNNLLANAVKFTPQGSIRFLVEPIGDSLERLMFTVEDTGIGIDAEAQTRLFRPFTQADSSTNRRFGGTGLGLSISKHLVELMGGRIGVESSLGSGSRFWFELPLRRGEGMTQNAMLPSMNRSYSGHILVAEDNPVNQQVVALMLENMGYAVTLVSNGLEVLSALERHAFDLVLMDCQMPEMDGYETSRRIRSTDDRLWATIPIVALTANCMSGDREKCLEAGMNDYLAKPIRMMDLEKTLDRWQASEGETHRFSRNVRAMKSMPAQARGEEEKLFRLESPVAIAE